MKHVVWIAIVVCGNSLLGCGARTPQGWGVHTVSWSQSTPDVEPIPGIDSASVHFGTAGGQPVLFIWSDAGGGGFGASFGRERQAIRFEGRYTARDGRDFNVEGSTADGETGTVTIDRRFPRPGK